MVPNDNTRHLGHINLTVNHGVEVWNESLRKSPRRLTLQAREGLSLIIYLESKIKNEENKTML